MKTTQKENLKFAQKLGLCPRSTFIVPTNAGIVANRENTVAEIFEHLRNRTLIKNIAAWTPRGAKRGMLEAYTYIAKKQHIRRSFSKDFLARLCYHFEQKRMVIDSYFFTNPKIAEFMILAAQNVAIKKGASEIVMKCTSDRHEVFQTMGFKYDHSEEFNGGTYQIKKTEFTAFEFDSNFKKLHHQLLGIPYCDDFAKDDSPEIS